jgi:hypothetical protein
LLNHVRQARKPGTDEIRRARLESLTYDGLDGLRIVLIASMRSKIS